MKTPMQEHYFLLIESKEHYKKLLKQETSVEGKQHYQGAIWAIQKIIDYIVAERMLEKEKEVIKKCIVMGMEFIPVDPSRYEEDSELIFNETFKTKER